ncbi:MAG: glycosyltransferase family 4 protein [Kiloniellales bacterium]
MKPPTHPTPSGDRRMARLLMQALRAGGHKVELASRLRGRDGTGDPELQRRLRARGERLARGLVERYRARPPGKRPQVWFTYHLYYKAPDWLGPAVTRSLGIPYLVAEASIAPKRAGGPWQLGHEASRAAVAGAAAVLCFNAVDAQCLRPLLADPGRLVRLKPFLDAAPFADGARTRARQRAALADRYALEQDQPWLIAVAMMRPGDKLASFRLLGRALARLADRPWRLLVAGDGPARSAVEAALAPLGRRVRFLGLQPTAALPALYGAADLCVWPAVREAYGMALLEAQAAGLPVVAGEGLGVDAVVHHGIGGLVTPGGDEGAFAAAVAQLLAAPERRQAMGRAAGHQVMAEHGIEAAARRLDAVLSRIVVDRAA